MSTHKGYALIAILATAVVGGIMPAFAVNELACPDCEVGGYDKLESYKQILPVVIWADKEVYDHQSTIVVNGHVSHQNPDRQVTLTVVGPTGNVVSASQLEPDDNGDFETTFATSSPLWMQNGFYAIKAQYGSINSSDQIEIEIVGEVSETETASCGTSEIAARVGSERYCISYHISGATVVGGTLDTESKSLIVKISTSDDGEITINMPRSVLDSKSGAVDDSFFVLVDGEETAFDEVKTSTTRSLTIPFSDGAEEIEIIGTQIVPEFGPIAALVLAIAIISIIALSAKTGLRLMPKY